MAVSVKFGSNAGTDVTVVSDTKVTVKTPAGSAGVVDVEVTTAGGSAKMTSAFTYVAAPTLTTTDPTSGPAAGGTTITLTGTGFKEGQ